ncbi:3-oxoacyl-ACP reductase FabG [Pelagibaculum spongiae]|uniref:3-oxoacyl-[acyl-carrier-protein] reductase n=1 Tax=Pelagibaculum spongiae TaxID=2080658 RepID=A0A2V1GTD7_9GAMM|nr:3-oxoacyl-ACP reductase FabG [Pelagibaculum spongiae]PVZ68935.1 3-oxoacyl-ACP reductase [Pelagibaculum spongiae]
MSEQRVALVTGASRGIGRAIAIKLAGEGHQVIGTATSAAGAEKISAYFAELGLKGCGKVLNVTEPESITGLISEITTEFGAPAILVNNAGITRDNLLMRMKDDQWDDIIQTNLSSVFRLSKACMRGMMKARWGRIVTIGSVVGQMGNAGQTNYAAAKAGLIGFSRSLAKEIGNRGITVNVITPGFIDTDMTKELSEEQRSALLANVSVPRFGQPEEIAHTAAFLTSENAGYITGETIAVNGGLYMG